MESLIFVQFLTESGVGKVPVASSGRQAFSFFSHKQKTFSIFISGIVYREWSQKKNLFTFHWSFVRHTHPPCNNETFSSPSMGLQFKPQKHACHSIQLKISVHPNQPRSWNTCHQRREERKNFPFCYSCQLLCVGCEKFAEWFMRSSSADNKSSAKLFSMGCGLMEGPAIFNIKNWNVFSKTSKFHENTAWCVKSILQWPALANFNACSMWWRGKLQIFRMITYWIFKPHLKHINFNDCSESWRRDAK